MATDEKMATCAKQELLFSFDKVDFDQESDEILEEYVESDDPVSEVAYRNHCWQMLQAWQRDREYLASLNLHRIIARHVRNSCRKASVSPGIESWLELGLESTLDGPQLANEIENAIRAAWKVRAPWRADAVLKLSEELCFESLDKFHLGLENIIGYPPTNTDFLGLMKREHEQDKTFQYQEGRDVDPQVEWNIVMGSESWNITGAGCEPTFEIKKREIGKPLDFYIQKAKGMFSDARSFGTNSETLMEAEVAALRLWTGPMHKRYAEALRNPTKSSSPYVTTLHALNSGITKLARIWRLPASRKVYRGYRDLSLKELKKDAFQCVGGVEKSVLATSEDINIAVQYSGDGAFILEMDVGQVNRGADVSWVSQFPHEQEILFNALSNVEFICSPQLRFFAGRGTILVYQVCVSANVKSKTLQEFVSLRKDLHLNLVDVLTQEVRRMIQLREMDSGYGLIQSLCAECKSQCDCVFKQAEEAEVGIYNNGAPAYVTLVKDAILLQSRVSQIIELALHWFDCGEVDPSKLDSLEDWQLEALRTAFRSGEVPLVISIVLDSEQVRDISSLFTAESLDLGAVHKPETACRAAKLLTLNPNLNHLKMRVASGTAEVWQQVFEQLCPGRPRLRVNGVFLAEYGAFKTLQQLDLRNLDIQKAAMIAPALQFHAPCALTSLSLRGSPIGCTGAESLGRAVSNLQKLRYVDLRLCQIGDRGCTGISRGLSALTELEELNLAHNNVKDDGFNILASAIRTGLSRLKSIDMRWNDTKLPSLRCGPQCVMRNHILSKFSTDGSVLDVAWSPGGDQIVSVGCGLGNAHSCDHYKNPGEIIIWDATSGDNVLTLKGHTTAVMCVDWCPLGDQIVSGGYGSPGEVIIWDAKTGGKISELKGHTYAVITVAWRPGGAQIASGSIDKTIIIWEAKTGEQVSTLKGHTSAVMCVAWRVGGDQIVSCNSRLVRDDNGPETTYIPGEIIIWDVKTGDQVSTLKGHTTAVESVAWHPGGDQIVAGVCGGNCTSDPGEIIIWDAKTGVQVSTLKGITGWVKSVAWRPCGDQIASSMGDEIVIWDAKTGEQVSTLKGGASTVAWCPSGDRIASDSRDNTIIIWDVKTGELVPTLKGLVTGVVWGAGGDQIACSCWGGRSTTYPGEIIIWNAKTGCKVSTLKGHTSAATSVAWRPVGDQIASGSQDGTIIIWDAKTGDHVSTLKGHTRPVRSVDWRPGGDQIASGSRDSTIIIWDAKSGEQISTLKGHTSVVNSVAWRPGGDQIVSGSGNSMPWDDGQNPGEIIIWDAKSGDQVLTLKGDISAVMCVDWCPWGDQIVSGGLGPGGYGSPGKVIIWDAKTGDKISELKGHTDAVNCVAWRLGGDQIVSGCGEPFGNASEIIIWNAKTGKQKSILKGHTSGIISVAWCPGRDQIASSSHDETILWDAKTGDRVSTQKGAVTNVAWRASGDQIASASQD